MDKQRLGGGLGRVRVGVLVTGLGLLLALGGTLHTSARGDGGDPVPTVAAGVSYKIEPGPGWPQGWTPPAAPTQIPPIEVDIFQQLQSQDSSLKHQVLWVMSPFPNWTKQYPYFWSIDRMQCGATDFVIAYPLPDNDVTRKYFGKAYNVQNGPNDSQRCTFSGVTQIAENKPLTPDQLEQMQLEKHANDDMYDAKLKNRPDGGLHDCNATAREGTPTKVEVCFNFGWATSRFDAPAYLDTQVGRVRVPIRFVSDMMGADVSWDNASQTATIHFPAVSKQIARPVPLPGYTLADLVRPHDYIFFTDRFKWALKTVLQPERTIQLTVGQPYAIVDGKQVALDAPPVIQPPGRTMVPIRFVSEAMGAKVYWVGDQPIWDYPDGTLRGRYQVHIITQFWPFYDYPDWHLETLAKQF